MEQEPESEARNVLAFYGDPIVAMNTISQQLVVLHGRAQVLVTLAGLAITVCGFSGIRIAAAGLFSQVTLISGLAVIIFSAYRVFIKVMRIHWLTRFLELPPHEALAAAIRERNRRLAEYHRCCHTLFAGAILYIIALGYMLIALPKA